ncbi:MAG: hypothetical protein ACYDER_25575 [Ktedonobacteraceae bacterium]
MMAVRLAAETMAPVVAPASYGGGRSADGVVVGLAFAEHGHEWVRDAGMIGLFHCADLSCDGHAVCPGCLNSIDVALHAPAAGLVVYWCVLHVAGGRRPARRVTR